MNVNQNASTEDIKKAFRKLVQLYHPDKFSNNYDYKEELLYIYEAYYVLQNNEKRRNYDLMLIQSSDDTNEENKIYSDKELVRCISNIQFSLTYNNLSKYNSTYLNQKAEEILHEKNLKHLLTGDLGIIDNAYENLILNLCKACNYETFINVYNNIYNKLHTNSRQKLKNIKRTKDAVFLFEKYKLIIIILGATLICLLLFFLIKS